MEIIINDNVGDNSKLKDVNFECDVCYFPFLKGYYNYCPMCGIKIDYNEGIIVDE